MTTTNRQKVRAIIVLKEMTKAGVPDVVTAREAVDLCVGYGVHNARWLRVSKTRQDFEPVSLAAVAKEIAKKETLEIPKRKTYVVTVTRTIVCEATNEREADAIARSMTRSTTDVSDGHFVDCAVEIREYVR